MEFIDVVQEIHRLEDGGDWGKLQQLSEMAFCFKDLRLYREHDGQLRYVSADANSEVDSIESNSCHECDGAPLKVFPFVVIDARGTRLYSDPPCFLVADQLQGGFGEVPRPGWKEQLEEAGISNTVIRKVKLLLEGHPPIPYFD